MFLEKGVLKICNKFKGEHPYRTNCDFKCDSCVYRGDFDVFHVNVTYGLSLGLISITIHSILVWMGKSPHIWYMKKIISFYAYDTNDMESVKMFFFFNIARVSKAEERMQLEHKSVTSVISQAKNVEQQLVTQQEQLVSKENQLAIQIQRLQEEVRFIISFIFLLGKWNILLCQSSCLLFLISTVMSCVPPGSIPEMR